MSDTDRQPDAALWRKKPVVVEAVRWTGANIEEVLPFFGDFSKLPRAPDDPHVHVGIGHCPPMGTLDIPTLEGTMTARAGDWIIKGVKGEFYPCKPDIFAATYEPVLALRSPDSQESPAAGHCEAAAPGDDARDAAREPTQAMIDAGYLAIQQGRGAKSVWLAMYDAAMQRTDQRRGE